MVLRKLLVALACAGALGCVRRDRDLGSASQAVTVADGKGALALIPLRSALRLPSGTYGEWVVAQHAARLRYGLVECSGADGAAKLSDIEAKAYADYDTYRHDGERLVDATGAAVAGCSVRGPTLLTAPVLLRLFADKAATGDDALIQQTLWLLVRGRYVERPVFRYAFVQVLLDGLSAVPSTDDHSDWLAIADLDRELNPCMPQTGAATRPGLYTCKDGTYVVGSGLAELSAKLLARIEQETAALRAESAKAGELERAAMAGYLEAASVSYAAADAKAVVAANAAGLAKVAASDATAADRGPVIPEHLRKFAGEGWKRFGLVPRLVWFPLIAAADAPAKTSYGLAAAKPSPTGTTSLGAAQQAGSFFPGWSYRIDRISGATVWTGPGGQQQMFTSAGDIYQPGPGGQWKQVADATGAPVGTAVAGTDGVYRIGGWDPGNWGTASQSAFKFDPQNGSYYTQIGGQQYVQTPMGTDANGNSRWEVGTPSGVYNVTVGRDGAYATDSDGNKIPVTYDQSTGHWNTANGLPLGASTPPSEKQASTDTGAGGAANANKVADAASASTADSHDAAGPRQDAAAQAAGGTADSDKLGTTAAGTPTDQHDAEGPRQDAATSPAGGDGTSGSGLDFTSLLAGGTMNNPAQAQTTTPQGAGDGATSADLFKQGMESLQTQATNADASGAEGDPHESGAGPSGPTEATNADASQNGQWPAEGNPGEAMSSSGFEGSAAEAAPPSDLP